MAENRKEGHPETTLLDELQDLLYINDPDTYELLYINSYTQKLCKLPDNISYKGQKCYQVLYGENSPCEFCPMARLNHQNFYVWDSFHNRMKRYYEHRDKMILWDDKDAHLSYSIDLTEQKKIENELLISEQRFQIAMDNSDRSLFDIDLITHTQYNRRLNAPFTGFQKLYKNVPESIIDAGMIHPDSIDAFRNLYQLIYYGDSEAAADIRVIDEKGQDVWTHFIITTIFRKDGSPLRAIGVAEDISTHKQLSIKYEKSKEYQNFLLRDSLLFLDLNLTANTVVRAEGHEPVDKHIFQAATAQDALKLLADQYVYPADQENFRNTFGRINLMTSYEEGTSSVELEHRFHLGDEVIWVNTTIDLNTSSSGNDTTGMLILRDIDSKKKHELQLLYQMDHDSMTGFYQYAAAGRIINDFISQTRSTADDAEPEGNQPTCSALILIQFNNINGFFAKYGSAMSEHYINSFCEHIRSMWRSDDIIMRINDNRFAVFAKGLISMKACYDAAKSTLENLHTYFVGSQTVELDIGCACHPYDGDTFEALYANAEAALLSAIALGPWQYNYYRSDLNYNSEADVVSALKQSEKEIEQYERSHPMKDQYRLKNADHTVFTLGNKMFHEVNSFSTFTMVTTLVVSVVLFLTLILGLYTNVFFDQDLIIPRIAWVILHAIILFLMWFRILYFYMKHIYADPLTGGSNKVYFTKIAPGLYTRPDMDFAIIYLNIRKFKLVNERYGRDAGDQILKDLHKLLDKSLLRREISARIVNDQFAMLLHFTNYDELEQRLGSIFHEIQGMTDSSNLPYQLDVAFGVYVISDKNLSVDEMLDCAHIAAGNISKVSYLPIGYYDDKVTLHMQYERNIESKMRLALSQKEFDVIFMPSFRTTDLQITGAEALIRWNDSELGLLSPRDFLPIFEKNGFVVQTDLYVFERICEHLHRCLVNGVKPYPISMNLSAVNFEIPNFLDVYRDMMTQYQIPPDLINFEFAEVVLYEHNDFFKQLIRQVTDMGCRCTLDDFGSSYSSLNLLKDLPLTKLKLDQSLITNPQIIKSITDFAHSLGFITVFEGIETQDELLTVQTAECDEVQGYLISNTITMEEFEKMAYGKKLK